MSAVRPVWFVILACSIAFGLRVGFTAWYRGGLDQPATHARCAADGVEYDQIARNLAAGVGYARADGVPTSFRPPGYPLAMAVVYAITGGSLTAIHLFFAACGAAGVAGTYLFAREVFTTETSARWAAALLAIYPPDIFTASNFLSEVAFGPCLAFGLWLAAYSRRRVSPSAAFAAGLVLGYSALTRGFAVLLLPLFAWYLLSMRPTRKSAISALLFSFAFGLVLTPWVARNYKVHGEFVLSTTNGGSTFYGANNPIVASEPRHFGNWVATNHLPGRAEIDAQPSEYLHDKKEFALGMEWVKSHPSQFLKIAPFKIVRFWLPFIGYASFKVYPIANILLTAPFLVLILLGLGRTLLSASRRSQFLACHLVMLVNLVMTVVFWGDGRFRDANAPVLMIYAVAGGAWVLGRRTRVSRQAL